MIRCYDCRQPTPDEQIVRRTVQTGSAENRYGKGRQNPRFYYRKVSLCQACSAARDAGEANRRHQRFILACLLVFFLVVFIICGRLLGWPENKATTRSAAPTTETWRK
jgi:hypothetical protein